MTRTTNVGQIVIVNGTSGSGKSTTCEQLVKRSDEFWLLYGIDHFMSGTFPSKFGHHGPRSHEGVYAHLLDESAPDGPLRWSFGEHGTRAFAVLHEWLAAASRQGCNIAFDHLMMSDPAVLQDIVWRLEGLPVLLVTLKPSYEVLSQRVASRTMDKPLPTDLLGADAVKKIIARLDRLRPWFYDAVYANDISDLTIDTEACGPDQVCAMIEARLAQGPGTAFDELRRKWPKS
jgi:chloramphenicol 3-O-phosphotransferase